MFFLKEDERMPPKPKFDKDDILNAAFELARAGGPEAVKAREVGEKLGSSSRPIFTFFISMEELQKCVMQKAWILFEEYLSAADEYVPAFKMRGIQLIRFAQNEPQLFRGLFMNGADETPFVDIMQYRLRSFAKDIVFIEQNYHASYEQALHIFDCMWLQAFGICSMIVNNRCTFTDAQISHLLGSGFAGQIMLLRSGDADYTKFVPVKKDSGEASVLTGRLPQAKNHQ